MDAPNQQLSGGVCRCCLDKGMFDDKYNMLNCMAVDMENISYSDMFLSCFSLNICSQSNMEERLYICDLCIIRLKDAFSFKYQVESTQKMLETELKRGISNVEVDDNVNMEKNDFNEDWNRDYTDENDDFVPKRNRRKTRTIRRRGTHKHKSEKSKKPPAKPRLKRYKTDWSIIIKECGSKGVTQDRWREILNSKLCLEENRCLVCNEVFIGATALRRHLNDHYPVYSCINCNKSFASKGRVVQHWMMHKEGSFACKKCKEVFSIKSKWRLHVHTHYSKLRNPCHLCPERFDDYDKLRRHMVTAHNARRDLHKCKECDSSFIRKEQLSVHVRRIHMKERNQICSACGLGFFSVDELKNHSVVHTGERMFECNLCFKRFALKKTLQQHMKTHKRQEMYNTAPAKGI